MKKFILMFALMISAFVGVNAQTAIETPKVLDNVYVGANVGATTPLTFNHVFSLNPTVGLTLGKNWTPIFGTEVQSGIAFNDNGFGTNSKTFVTAINTGVNGTINLTNLFLGYNPNKVFEMQTVTGLGWAHLYGNTANNDDDELTAKTGIRLNWNLGKAKAWSLNVEPAVLWNLTNGSNDQVRFNKKSAQLALSLGVVYKFKTSNGTHNFKEYNIGELNDVINSLHAQKPKEVVREVVKEKIVETNVSQTQWVVFFEQGKSDLTDDAKDELNKIGENTIVDIKGHASSEGSEAFNQTLSEKRAKAVADFLTNRGVKVNKVVGEGETGTPKNRVAIVKVAK